MDNDAFRIVARLDIPKSVKLIKEDIQKIEGQFQSDKVKITAGLNIAKSKNLIQAQLNTLANQAKAPTIKIGIDTSAVKNTQNISNGLKEVQAQANRASNAVSQITTSMSANNVPSKAVSEFQKAFNIVGESAKNTSQTFKSLFAELNNSWYSGNEEKYLSTLEQIYNVAKNTTKVVNRSKSEISELVSQVKSGLSDGSKAFISPKVKEELSYILGEAKNIKKVLDSVYGIGNWTYKRGNGVATDILADDTKKIKGYADEIVNAYKQIQSIKSGSQYTAFDTLGGDTEAKKVIDERLQSILKLKSAYVDLQGTEHTYIRGMGWFEEIISDSNQASSSVDNLNSKVKELTSLTSSSSSKNYFSNSSEILRSIQLFGEEENAIKSLEQTFKSLGATVTSTERRTNNGTLDGFTVSVKSATGEVENFNYKFKNLNAGIEGADENWKYVLTNITATDKGIQRLITSYQKAQDKIQSVRTNLASSLKSAGTSYLDVNGSKPILDETHIKNFNSQYVHALRSIAQLKNADETTMASMKANAEKEIDALKRMGKEYQNAEYAATSLRTKDLNTNKSIQTQELDRFINKISSSKQIFNAMSSDIIQLKTSLNNMSDATSFTKFLNEMDIAKAKFESLKTMYQTIGGYDKQLDKLAQDWQKQGIYAGNLKTTIESLKTSLLGVNTADGLTNWIGDFNTQIGAISQLPVKIAEYRNQLSSVKTEWDEHHTNVKSVENAFGKLGSRLGRIKKEAKFNEWVKDFENLVLQSNRLKTNLDSQVSTQNRIYEIQSKIAKLNPTKDSAEIARLNEKLSAEQKTLSNLQMQSNVYSNLVSLEQQEQYITEQTVKSRDKLLSATNTGVKQYQTTITNAITELQSIANSAVFRNNASNPAVTQTKQGINSLITAYQNLATKLRGNITPAGLETVRTELTQLNARFNQATSSAKNFETQLKSDNSAEQLAQRVAVLNARIDAYAKANPKAMPKFGGRIDSMVATLKNNPDLSAVNKVAKEFQMVQQEIKKADVTGKTFFQNLADKAKKFSGWMSMTYAISLVTRTIRGMIAGVIDLDTAIVDLRKTFKGTEADLENFYNSATQTAKEVGVSSKEIIEQAAAWSN